MMIDGLDSEQEFLVTALPPTAESASDPVIPVLKKKRVRLPPGDMRLPARKVAAKRQKRLAQARSRTAKTKKPRKTPEQAYADTIRKAGERQKKTNRAKLTDRARRKTTANLRADNRKLASQHKRKQEKQGRAAHRQAYKQANSWQRATMSRAAPRSTHKTHNTLVGTRRPWTQGELNELQRFAAAYRKGTAKHTVRTMAKKLKRSMGSLRIKLHNNGWGLR